MNKKIFPKLRLMIEKLVLLGLLSILVGCASVPQGDVKLQVMAEKVQPPEGLAGIYFFRPFAIPSAAILFQVKLDNSEFGQLSTDSYLYGFVKPGEYTIGLGYSAATVHFTAEAGQSYFFQSYFGFPAIKVKRIDEIQGKKYMSEMVLSKYNVFDVYLEVSPALEGGYPQQGLIIGLGGFENKELKVSVEAAVPREVTGMYGSKFASLRGLAVVLVSPDNKNPEGPLVLRRSNVSLELPDGNKIYPLDEQEMTKWGAEVGIQSADDIYGKWSDDWRREIADGVFRIYQDRPPRSIDFVFRFPNMIIPRVLPSVIGGVYKFNYIIETPSGEKVPLQNKVPLNIKQ